MLDLVAAAMLSVGANLLGAVLVSFGTRPNTRVPHALDTVPTTKITTNTAPPTNGGQPVPTPVPTAENAELMTARPQSVGNVVQLPSRAVRADALVSLIEQCGGTLKATQRDIAVRVGTSKGGLSKMLTDLQSSGRIEVVADRREGTVVRLKVA